MVSTNEVVVESAPIVNIAQEPVDSSAGPEEDFDKAQKKYQLGKKNLLLNKYDDAVNNIGDACKVYSIKFGEFAPECAEVYFTYGKALLELARVENTVLGNALSGVPEDNEPIDDSRYGNPDDVAEQEKEEIADKVIDAMCETPTTTTVEALPVEAGSGESVQMVAEGEQQQQQDVVVDEVVKPIEEVVAPVVAVEEPVVAGEAAVVVEKKEGEEENGEGEDEEGEEEDGEEVDEEDLTKNDDGKGGNDEAEAEDISNLQRAWEMFELAKLVFGKNFDNDLVYKNKRIAECLIKLGEISIEQELYEQALTDIKESIRMQEERQASERDERMLAESYYQFGLAYQFSDQFQLAGEQYQKSINILQIRIDKLKALIEQTSDEFEKTTFKDEITELEAILPEMVSKLEEIKEQGEQSLKFIKEAKELMINKIDDGQLGGGKCGSAEVKDITSLVKSKRKIESVVGEETAIKKTRVESSEDLPESTTTATIETPIETDAAPVELPTEESTPAPVENGN